MLKVVKLQHFNNNNNNNNNNNININKQVRIEDALSTRTAPIVNFCEKFTSHSFTESKVNNSETGTLSKPSNSNKPVYNRSRSAIVPTVLKNIEINVNCEMNSLNAFPLKKQASLKRSHFKNRKVVEWMKRRSSDNNAMLNDDYVDFSKVNSVNKGFNSASKLQNKNEDVGNMAHLESLSKKSYQEISEEISKLKTLETEFIELSKMRHKRIEPFDHEKKHFIENQLIQAKSLPGLFRCTILELANQQRNAQMSELTGARKIQNIKECFTLNSLGRLNESDKIPKITENDSFLQFQKLKRPNIEPNVADSVSVPNNTVIINNSVIDEVEKKPVIITHITPQLEITDTTKTSNHNIFDADILSIRSYSTLKSKSVERPKVEIHKHVEQKFTPIENSVTNIDEQNLVANKINHTENKFKTVKDRDYAPKKVLSLRLQFSHSSHNGNKNGSEKRNKPTPNHNKYNKHDFNKIKSYNFDEFEDYSLNSEHFSYNLNSSTNRLKKQFYESNNDDDLQDQNSYYLISQSQKFMDNRFHDLLTNAKSFEDSKMINDNERNIHK